MSRPRMRLGSSWPAVAVALVSACSSGGSSARSPKGTPLPPTVCESRVITAADVSDLLTGPITTKGLAGDPQSCVFEGANSTSITFSVRPGLGEVSVGSWTSGKMPVPGAPVNDVGDKAVWQDTLRELIATKHNVLCDVQATGTTGSAAQVQRTFAALCGKIWAAQ